MTTSDAEDPSKLNLSGDGIQLCRIVNGVAQENSDDATGDDPTAALHAMDRLAEAGLTTFQLGNAQGGGRELAERRAGAYLKSMGTRGSGEITFLTTVSLGGGGPVTRRAVRESVERSFERMGVERLDLVQLCWKDFEDWYFLDALYYLEEIEGVSNVGVCGFGAAPLALTQKNGLTIASNLVPSSMVRAPPGGVETIRRCRDQGIALISSRGSLGGLAGRGWLYRSAPRPEQLRQMPLASRQALSDIYAWGHGAEDPWHLYQSELLPVLESVARKHARGRTIADVATAFHLRRRASDWPRGDGLPDENAEAGGGGSSSHGSSTSGWPRGGVVEGCADALCVPVRVRPGMSGARRAADEDEEAAGRRGAELAQELEEEDLDLIAEAVGAGSTMGDIPARGSVREEEEEEVTGEQEEVDGEGEDGEWRGPQLFLF